ncbi:hypothetical protein CALCODRAFT_327995 [Calocera cornea HHB12733]|uniref:PHD-type domain-containing protein n=1 Tax=Calocera cornea HHB12733 TaxID=1353952 RepID=A0A165JHG0_9BASI|nr:hypothetical protein CALCODRAFT_327995 [Calocera cornea HHB12733]
MQDPGPHRHSRTPSSSSLPRNTALPPTNHHDHPRSLSASASASAYTSTPASHHRTRTPDSHEIASEDEMMQVDSPFALPLPQHLPHHPHLPPIHPIHTLPSMQMQSNRLPPLQMHMHMHTGEPSRPFHFPPQSQLQYQPQQEQEQEQERERYHPHPSHPPPSHSQPSSIPSIPAIPSLPSLTPTRAHSQPPSSSLPISPLTPKGSRPPGPIGLGIFSPFDRAAAEVQAAERKRKRLAAFDQVPVPATPGRMGVQRMPEGEGRVLVPFAAGAKEDDEMMEVEDAGLEELRTRLKVQAGWVDGLPRHPLATVPSLPGPPPPEDPRERERRSLLERFLESDESEPEEEAEEEKSVESGSVGGGGGGWAMGRGKTVVFPTAAGGKEKRLWVPRSGDAMLALLAATRARRRRGVRAKRSREDSLGLSGSESDEEENVNCPCGSGVDDGTSMVQCDACECWSHMHCVAVDPDQLPEQWFCRSCARARKGKGRAAAPAAAGRAVLKGKGSKVPKPRGRKTAGKGGLHSPPPTGLATTKMRPAMVEPSTPTPRAPVQREPTFAPADDSGIHGRAAMRMAGAEILVPRTPTPSQGGATPWLNGTPGFGMPPSPDQERERQHGAGYGVFTPLSSRKQHLYSNPYASPYSTHAQPPPQISPLKYQPRYPEPNAGYWQTTPRLSDESERSSPESHRRWSGPGAPQHQQSQQQQQQQQHQHQQYQHQHPPSAGLSGPYDFGSTPSRGLKFGAPFANAGMMTPINLAGGFQGAQGGTVKRRSWEAPPTGASVKAPTWGLLTPVVGDDSPSREREREYALGPGIGLGPGPSPAPGQGHSRVPSYGFSAWVTSSPDVPSRSVPPPPVGYGQPMYSPGRTKMQPPPPAPAPGGLGAPFSMSSERTAGRPAKGEESDEEGDVRHMIEQM